jgi:predicted homoserine dehydrogenase-like protein
MPGEKLDGEGGYTVWGRLMPATDSLAINALPIGLAADVLVLRAVKQGEVLRQGDVALDANDPAVKLRHAMEAGSRGAQ